MRQPHRRTSAAHRCRRSVKQNRHSALLFLAHLRPCSAGGTGRGWCSRLEDPWYCLSRSRWSGGCVIIHQLNAVPAFHSSATCIIIVRARRPITLEKISISIPQISEERSPSEETRQTSSRRIIRARRGGRFVK